MSTLSPSMKTSTETLLLRKIAKISSVPTINSPLKLHGYQTEMSITTRLPVANTWDSTQSIILHRNNSQIKITKESQDEVINSGPVATRAIIENKLPLLILDMQVVIKRKEDPILPHWNLKITSIETSAKLWTIGYYPREEVRIMLLRIEV